MSLSHIINKYFLPFCRLFFHFVDVSFDPGRMFDVVSFVYFALFSLLLVSESRNLAKFSVMQLFPVFLLGVLFL